MKKGLYSFLATMMFATTCAYASMHPSPSANRQFCNPLLHCEVSTQFCNPLLHCQVK